jgi:hypothetical protein
MRFDCEVQQPREALHGVRRPGFYEHSPLTGRVQTGILDLRIRTAAHVVRRVTRQLIGRHGADSAVFEDDARKREDVRGRSVVLRSRLQQPTKIGDGGQHPRRNGGVTPSFFAGTGEQPKSNCSLSRWMRHDVFSRSWGERIATPTVSGPASANCVGPEMALKPYDDA